MDISQKNNEKTINISKTTNTENLKKIKRIRTIRSAISMILECDSKTAITYNFIRKLCDKNLITSIKIGKKILINYDQLLEFLNIEEC